MEDRKGKMVELQNALRGLDLEPRRGEDLCSDQVLVGKLLSSKVFRRFTISEIVSKTWKTKTRVALEKIGDNVFKFQFGSKEDREMILRGRPWSMNGALLILKEWPERKALSEISFTHSAFVLQIHGLPPVLLHEGTAEKIGNMVGKTQNVVPLRKCVVANRFLRVRVEISVESPIPTGFFYERENREDLWIQFKYERLSDLCFRCSMLDHVTGKCKYGEPATVTNNLGISARTYGPWIKAENDGSLLFINLPEEGEPVRQEFDRNRKLFEISYEEHEENALSDISHGQKALQGTRDPPEVSLENAAAMNVELYSLNLTLKRQCSGEWQDMQAVLLHQVIA